MGHLYYNPDCPYELKTVYEVWDKEHSLEAAYSFYNHEDAQAIADRNPERFYIVEVPPDI